MNNLIKIVAALPLLMSSLYVFSAELSVYLPQTKQRFDYSTPMRLERVLADIQSQADSLAVQQFPYAMQLFDRSEAQKALQLKQQVISELKQLGLQEEKWQISTQLLVDQIEKWKVGQRKFIEMDYDAVRLNPAFNPMLEGEYELVAPRRDNRVSIEGLVFNPSAIKLNPDYTISEYLDESMMISSSHPSYVWLIQADGKVLRVGYAHWNNQKQQVMPGSVIFVGFNSKADNMVKMEQAIVSLIRMRKKY
ncbi:capsule biosynthesis GfcC family protein [Vibrio sp. JPW-9-11-11]|uniref:capsule biosynthesis GfcC family protein n=1 Tax=Vibrio sp. JPW-9-11-11 TaxID=1416532 RepID=UPI001592D158|nr:capsule biosynthesis GfcC family protein [Vibrio sp. JPW-9-11-11]